MSVVNTYSFEVTPVSPACYFEPFVMDVPSLSSDPARAARRAYFTVMAMMSPRGVDVEDFHVFEFVGDERGRAVGPGGFTE